MSKKKINKNISKIFAFIVLALILWVGGYFEGKVNLINETSNLSKVYYDIESIPAYSGNPYVYINNNLPSFEESDYTTKKLEYYSKLDNLGRCGVAYANICKNLMPDADDERDSLYNVTPSGWQQTSYKGVIEGNYLYNRCHLIGYQLAGENANERNLITGTRYMNTEGMLPFENMVAEYIEENKNNHVLYRVNPIFEGDNLVASGVQMEAYSIEDNGKGISFNIYVYNVQPGIVIDYATGESSLEK